MQIWLPRVQFSVHFCTQKSTFVPILASERGVQLVQKKASFFQLLGVNFLQICIEMLLLISDPLIVNRENWFFLHS